MVGTETHKYQPFMGVSMENLNIIQQIVQGLDAYSEFLAAPPHMDLYDDGMCAWMKPKKGAKGAAYVYKVNFGEKSHTEIDEFITAYRKMGMPQECFLTPLSTPGDVRELFGRLGVTVGGGSHGMALSHEKMHSAHWEEPAQTGPVRRVETKDAFDLWANLVNEVLFDYPILDPEFYFPLCEKGELVCFLGYANEEPVATAATLQRKENGTLEFISTKPAYRRKGMGSAVCRAAIHHLVTEGANCISLRGTPEGTFLYESLGFIKYFDF